MRYLFTILFTLAATLVLKAQDPHFSQFFASPLTLNPAFTGKFDGVLRAAGNYRNQWPTINQAYRTSTLSVDFPIFKNSIDYRDILGVGIMGFTDKSAAGAVSYNYVSISTAFHKGLDEDGYKQIGLGLQGTFSNMSINTSKLFFESQLTSSGFDVNIPSGETFGNSDLTGSYFDLNAGLLYTASTNDQNNFYGGVSLYHINRPQQNFLSGKAIYLLEPRATLQAGGYFPIGETTTLHLSGQFSTQAKAYETMIGGAVEFAVGDAAVTEQEVNFYAGGWLRFGDALSPYIGLDYKNVRFGVSYDINISNLKAASQSRGGIEISLIYIAKTPGSKGVPCPKF